MSKDLAEGVQRVADYIEAHGWHQGDMFANSFSDAMGWRTPACLMGANIATNVGRGSDAVLEHLTDMVNARGDLPPLVVHPDRTRMVIEGSELGTVSYYNDKVAKTKDEVLEFLEKARIAAEEKA